VKSAELVDAVVEGRDRDGLRIFAPLAPGDRTERPIMVDQTNSSVVVGERVVVKWMRSPGADRSPRLLAHLAAAGFTRMPAPYAALFSGGALVALVTQFLPEALDGYDWGTDALLAWLAGGPPADFGAALGELTAELHAALATPTAIIPQPVSSPPPAEDWKTAVDEAVAAAGDDADGRWVRSIAHRLTADLATPAREKPGPALLLHGDLHVGQVLKWRDGYAVTDFDGHPTAADRPEPVVRDVAQLRMSVLHVAEIANRRTAGAHRAELRDWGRRTNDELLAAYRAGDRRKLLDVDLLRSYEVEQECRELVYAARFLPRWRYASMGVLKSWYEKS
jgi:maltokinase